MTIIISKDGKDSQKLYSSDFPNEDYLQKYITENPDIIPLSDIQERMRLMIISREFGTNSGSIDALGIDQEGQLYIIETKLYKNPDKRKVVAQVLDYGASLWKNFNNYDSFSEKIERETQSNFHMSFNQRLKEFFGIDDDALEDIHKNISSCLKDGSLKFVILMDRLYQELKDLITFVNQNSKFDIYAVELEFYKHEEFEIMIPKLFGTEVKKSSSIKYESIGPRTEEYHFDRFDEKAKELYQEIKKQALLLGDDVKIIPLKFYIAFKRNTNFMDVELRNSKILVFLNMNFGTIDDPKNMARDVNKIGHYGNGDYEITIKDPKDIEYVISLAKISYNNN